MIFRSLCALIIAGIVNCLFADTPDESASRSLVELQQTKIDHSGGVPKLLKTDIRSEVEADHLEWSCRISSKTIMSGDPIYAEISVRNSSADKSYRFALPFSGFLMGHLQGWYRVAGETNFIKMGSWKGYGQYGVAIGEPICLHPGESRCWITRLNNFSILKGESKTNNRLPFEFFSSFGSVYLTKPGRYEIAIRYVNLFPDNDDRVNRLSTNETTSISRENFIDIAKSAKLFGLYKITVVDRLKDAPHWAEDAIKSWTVLLPTGSDIRIGHPAFGDDPLDKLTNRQLVTSGDLGFDVRMWQLGRAWPEVRKSDKIAKEYLDKLRATVAGLPANHPHRCAAELFSVAADIERGNDYEAFAAGLASTNPDVSYLIKSWMGWRMQKSKR